MNDTLQKQWFVTHSETGSCDPNGFFCHDCFKKHSEEAIGFLSGIVTMINPEDSPYYECNTCRKDYRY